MTDPNDEKHEDKYIYSDDDLDYILESTNKRSKAYIDRTLSDDLDNADELDQETS